MESVTRADKRTRRENHKQWRNDIEDDVNECSTAPK